MARPGRPGRKTREENNFTSTRVRWRVLHLDDVVEGADHGQRAWGGRVLPCTHNYANINPTRKTRSPTVIIEVTNFARGEPTPGQGSEGRVPARPESR